MRHLQVSAYRKQQLTEEGQLLIRNIMGEIVHNLGVQAVGEKPRGLHMPSRNTSAKRKN